MSAEGFAAFGGELAVGDVARCFIPDLVLKAAYEIAHVFAIEDCRRCAVAVVYEVDQASMKIEVGVPVCGHCGKGGPLSVTLCDLALGGENVGELAAEHLYAHDFRIVIGIRRGDQDGFGETKTVGDE